LKTSVGWKSSHGSWSLVEPSKKGKKEKGERAAKKREIVGMGKEGLSFHLGPKTAF
jgi:hypothetical protein